MILLQALLSVALFCAPFFVLIWLSGKPDNGMWLLFPLFGAVPALIGAFVLFAPLEAWLDHRGLAQHANVAVPAAGASIVFIFAAVMFTGSGRLLEFLRRLATGGMKAWAPFLLWAVFGAMWGALWRLSGWVQRAVA